MGVVEVPLRPHRIAQKQHHRTFRCRHRRTCRNENRVTTCTGFVHHQEHILRVYSLETLRTRLIRTGSPGTDECLRWCSYQRHPVRENFQQIHQTLREFPDVCLQLRHQRIHKLTLTRACADNLHWKVEKQEPQHTPRCTGTLSHSMPRADRKPRFSCNLLQYRLLPGQRINTHHITDPSGWIIRILREHRPVDIVHHIPVKSALNPSQIPVKSPSAPSPSNQTAGIARFSGFDPTTSSLLISPPDSRNTRTASSTSAWVIFKTRRPTLGSIRLLNLCC